MTNQNVDPGKVKLPEPTAPPTPTTTLPSGRGASTDPKIGQIDTPAPRARTPEERVQLLGAVANKLQIPGAGIIPSLQSAFNAVPERYPGYKQEYFSAMVDERLAYSDLTQAENAAFQTKQPLEPDRWSLGAFIKRVGDPTRGLAELAPTMAGLSQGEVDKIWEAKNAANARFVNTRWRAEILRALPADMGSPEGHLRSIEDVLESDRYNNPYLTADDRAWLEVKMEQLRHIIPEVEITEGVRGEAEEALLKPARPKFVSMHSMSLEEMDKALSTLAMPELPEGLTAEQAKDIMASIEFSAEDQEAIDSIEEFVLESERNWQAFMADMELRRIGLLNAELPELTAGQWAMMTFTQPALASYELLEKYFNTLPRPIVARFAEAMPEVVLDMISAATSGAGTIAGAFRPEAFKDDPWGLVDMKALVNEYRYDGEHSSGAYAAAFNDSSGSIAHKIIMESIADPTMYFGFGILSKYAKSQNIVLRYMGAFERGFMEAIDVPFKALVHGIKQIPRTPGQAAFAQARAAYRDFEALVGREYGTMLNLTPQQIQDVVEKAVNLARTLPNETGNLAVRVGNRLLEHNFLNKNLIGDWTRKFGVDTEVTQQLVHDVNYHFELMFNKKWKAKADPATKMLNILGVETTKKNVDNMVKLLMQRESQIVNEAIELGTKGETVKHILENIFSNRNDLYNIKFASEEYRFANQSGMSVGRFGMTVDKMLRWNTVSWWDRNITGPMANQYLQFTNYGVFNLVETSMRSVLGGGTFFYPMATDPIQASMRAFTGLTNVPFELIDAAKGLGRLEMAIVNPRTGEATIYKSGRVPFVTRDVGDIGRTITIGGKKYRVTSMQTWSDMYADMSARIRAWNLMGNYHKQLERIAPDSVQEIARAIDRNAHYLDGVTAFSQKERKGMLQTILHDAYVGPDAIQVHNIPITEMERKKALNRINEELAKLDAVFEPHKQSIRDGVITGRIFRDIQGSMESVQNSLMEYSLAGLQSETQALQRFAGDLVSIQPRNADELMMQIAFMSDVVEAADNKVSEARRIVQKLTQGMTPEEKTLFHHNTWDEISNYLESVEKEMDYMGGMLKRNINGEDFRMNWDDVEFKGFDEFEVSGLKELIDTLPIEMKSRLNTIRLDESITLGDEPAEGIYDYLVGDITLAFAPISPAAGVRSSQAAGVFYHEMMHGMFQSKWDMGDKQFMRDFLKAIGKKDDSAQVEFVNKAENLNWDSLTFIREQKKVFEYSDRPTEMLSSEFGNLQGVGIEVTPGFRGFVDSHMPMKLEFPTLNTVQQANAIELLDNSYERSFSLKNTREAERLIAEDLIQSKPKFKTPAQSTAWWDNFYAQRDVPWQQYWVRNRQLMSQMERLRLALRPDLPSTSSIPLPDIAGSVAPEHIAYIMQLSGDDMTRALLSGSNTAIFSKDKFVAYVGARADNVAGRHGKTAAEIGFTDDAIGEVYDQLLFMAGIDPRHAATTPDLKTAMQVDAITKELELIKATMKWDDADSVAMNRFITSVTDDLKKMPIFGGEAKVAAPAVPDELTALRERAVQAEARGDTAELEALRAEVEAFTPPPEAVPPTGPQSPSDWLNTREQALANARSQFELDFTNYSDQNAVDALMRTIFPFWTYEIQRYQWLPRAFLRSPGTATGLGRYMNYTDEGYVAIPGTDVQFNPLRGTVFMGGFRRLMMKDYPEYQDTFPGISIIDSISRYGFFPGIGVMLPISIYGAAHGQPEFGELLPAWAKSAVSAYLEVAPNSAPAKWLTERFFPDRFRDYLTMMTLSAKGIEGKDLWDKKRAGTMTPEEREQWANAMGEADGWKGVLFNQTGVFRLRPEEYVEYLDQYKLLLSEALGVPVEILEDINRRYPVTGKRVSDIYNLDILQQKLMREWEAYRLWQGVTAPLQPSSFRAIETKIREYYNTIEEMHDSARHTGLTKRDGTVDEETIDSLNAELHSGIIDGRAWVNGVMGIKGRIADTITYMQNTVFKDVPVTLEQREDYYREKGIPIPTEGPDEELLRMYFELTPLVRYSWESHRKQKDLDLYYAMVDAIIDTLSEPFKSTFIDTIQFKWSDTEKLYWNTSKEHIRPWMAVRSTVLDMYTPDQRRIIERFELSSGQEEKDLREELMPDGTSVTTQFDADVGTARKNLRLLNPEQDAWLKFWGKTSRLLTPAAEEAYARIISTYTAQGMIQ